MTEDKFVFEYIKGYFSLIHDYLAEHDIVYIYGEPRIGKTYLAKMCADRVLDNEYYKLHLKANCGYNPNYFTFQTALSQSDALYEAGKELLADVSSQSDKLSLKMIGTFINGLRLYQQTCFRSLSDADISIINRISFHCKKRALYVIADDFDAWDEASKNLLRFFMTPEARRAIPFLKHSKILILGEKEITGRELREQLGAIKSFSIKGCLEKSVFVNEFSRIHAGNVDLAETLFQMTNGNLGMASDIGFYMKESGQTGNVALHPGELKAKKLFLSVIDDRVRNINQGAAAFVPAMKAASIQGTRFDKQYLPAVIGEDEFTVDRVLSLAKQEHFLSLVKNEYDYYNFINNYIYQYFDENYNEYRKEYHYKFACAAKKVRAGDYYTQYLHLRAAGKRFESAENLVVHLIGQKLKHNIIDSRLLEYLQEVYSELYHNYLIISQSMDAFNQGNHQEAIMKLEMVSPVSELVFLEKEYLMAYFIYDGWVYGRNEEACEILTENFDSLLDTNFDMWLRSGLLLYIFYVNRLHNALEAKTVEKKIMKEIAKRYRDDSSLETMIHVLNRNAGALYSTEIAIQKLDKSICYFLSHAHTMPQEYIYALTNHSGLSLVASSYKDGFLSAQKAIALIGEKNIWIKDLGKIINNYLVNGVMSGELPYDEALELCEALIQSSPAQKNVLLKSNYYIFKTFAGRHAGLLEEIKELFQSDSVQKHNDYYVYLIGFNYMFISVVMGNFSLAESIYRELHEMVPAICISEEAIIKRRYHIFKNIIAVADPAFTNLKVLESYFQNNLANLDSDYGSKPYILTDQQFWSVI